MNAILYASIFQLFLGALADYGNQHPPQGSLEELISALNTSGPIWMVKRTYNKPNHSCVYSKMVLLNGTDYEFLQSYMDNGIMKQRHLYAHLATVNDTATGEGAMMTVSEEKRARWGTNYLLVISTPIEKCGILSFFNNATNRYDCEMYAWNETVQTELHECKECYRLYCSQQNEDHTVYNNECTEDPGC
ncbi:uncharacterized protein LOC119462299 [Dermacentor silvarum]|uniref:uncharacterized protein LOC119462299 n=1 Tax=Dermacentor silvarum TaxID=543639 RepID=UPI00189A37AB|nr:uncharacterized protein LOC119462299 [Dermacentor silvarum]